MYGIISIRKIGLLVKIKDMVKIEENINDKNCSV